MRESTTTVADEIGDAPAAVQRALRGHRDTLEEIGRLGWLAKGIVYLLFGIAAVVIATGERAGDDASPTGALSRVSDVSAGRLLLGVLGVGLLLFCAWRIVTAILTTGSDPDDWLQRLTHTFSAVVYAALGYSALRAAAIDRDPDSSSTIESMSRSLLDDGVGRWLVGVGGVVTIGVGAYFIVQNGVRRAFADDLEGIDGRGIPDTPVDAAIVASGIAGWIGRGAVTVLVGFFLTAAAIEFDASEARGFDQALREATESTVGVVAVWISAIGLIAYGVFCIVSHRRRTLDA